MSAASEATIELVESSGPVSPRFQYAIEIRIVAAGGKARVTSKRHGKADVTRDLSSEDYERLWETLAANDALSRGADLIGDKASRKGVSKNHVEIATASEHARIDYLLAQAKDPENAWLAAIVAAIKALG